MAQDYRSRSREQWVTEKAGALTIEELTFGAILRIADASELMAKNHANLVAERDYLERRFRDSERELAREKRRSAALRGVIKRMKAGE